MEQQSERIKSQLAKLEDEVVQRRLAVQRFDPDCIRALDWVEQNRSKFERPIWGPVVLQVLLGLLFVEPIVTSILGTAHCERDAVRKIRRRYTSKVAHDSYSDRVLRRLQHFNS